MAEPAPSRYKIPDLDSPAKDLLSPAKKTTKAALEEEELLPADVDRKVAQGICVLVGPLKFDDDEEGEEREVLRTKFKRKLIGKIGKLNEVSKLPISLFHILWLVR